MIYISAIHLRRFSETQNFKKEAEMPAEMKQKVFRNAFISTDIRIHMCENKIGFMHVEFIRRKTLFLWALFWPRRKFSKFIDIPSITRTDDRRDVSDTILGFIHFMTIESRVIR